MESMNINDLKQMRIWILWQSKVKNGKTTKVPFSANGGTMEGSANCKHT